MTTRYALGVCIALGVALVAMLAGFAAAFGPATSRGPEAKRDVRVRFDYGANGDGTRCYWHGGLVPCSWGVHNLRVIYRVARP